MEDISTYLVDKQTILDQITPGRPSQSDTEASHREKRKSARTIQRVLRGHLFRAYFATLHASARLVQARFRHFKSRMELNAALTAEVRVYFDQMATLIQKAWRGHLSRTTRFDYEDLHCFLAHVQNENFHVDRKLRRFHAECERRHASCKQQYWDEIRRRLHHLLRTKSVPGVFSDRNCRRLSQLEECIKTVGPDPIRTAQTIGNYPGPIRRAQTVGNCPGPITRAQTVCPDQAGEEFRVCLTLDNRDEQLWRERIYMMERKRAGRGLDDCNINLTRQNIFGES